VVEEAEVADAEGQEERTRTHRIDAQALI